MALVRTDYGLIYNTDGSLCATLLPEGGVAVTEGTTNLVTDQSFWNTRTGAIVTRELVTSGQWAGWYRVHVTRTGTGARGYIGNTQLISVAVDSTHTWSIDFYSETGKIIPRLDGAFGIGDLSRVNERRWALTWTNNKGSGGSQGVYFYHIDGAEIDVDEVFYYRWYQVEAKPYDTPYVEGTRPVGALSYSSLLVAGKNEIAILMKLTKPQLLQTPWAHHALAIYRPTFTPSPDSFVLFANNGTNELRFRTRDSEGLNQDDIRIENCWDDDEHLVVAYMNHNPASGRHKKELYFDGELVGYSDPAGLPDLSNVQDVRLGHWDSSSFWGTPITMFCIKPTCTPEMVKTWHSLDAPFFDPREQIDAAATPIHMQSSEIDGYGHTVRDQYGNKAVFSGVDPDTGDRGYKVYDTNGSDEVTFLGVKADGRRGLMLKEGDTTWLDPGGIAGSKVMSLPWTSLDSVTHLLFAGLFEGNFIIADENGEYGFNFGEGASQIKSYVLKATEDAYVNSLGYSAFGQVYSWRDVNYGSETRLRIANNAEYDYGVGRTNYDKYAYIKFSGLSSIPASEEIVDAELRLYFTNLSATRFILAVPAATWSETTITWNNQPGSPYAMMEFDAKLGTTIIKKAPFIDLINLLNLIRANGWEDRGFRIQAFNESRGESVLYSREGHSTLCPTLVVYTRESQTPIPGLNLHVPGGPVFLNRKIFDVPGKTLTLDANRNDITLYVYENEDGEAVIDFAHGGRAFKADSYVVLGSATTSSSAITGISKKRNSGRKEGPRGMGNDVYSFGYPGDEIAAVDISTVIRTPVITHNLGGNKHQIKLEIKPAGLDDWLTFEPVAYADGNNKKGTTLKITSDALSLIAGTDSIYRYIDSAGSPIDVTSAEIRGIIVRLD
jgi:hypothetical protein